MEAVLALLALGFVALVVAGPIVALVAWTRTSRLAERIDALSREVADLQRARRAATVAGKSASVPATPAAPARAAAEVPATAPPPPPGAPPPVTMPAPVAVSAPVPVPAPTPVPVPAAQPRPPRPPVTPPAADPPLDLPEPSDFASDIGPKILVATGALALMVFLGLFVKYAWDNNWVGPAGRVLIGAVFGLGLLALGVRLMGREYRPLGQGLAAAGLAGLYTSAFAAHGFYGLIPSEVSGVLMIAITASAVLLAVRLDARLLAALAWTGGYMTPLLLSTGQDRALALFVYLGLLDAGAMFIDRRKPWPETAPIAMTGTVLLYSGWYSRFFRPERFEVAAFGLVLFTALFALGMARRRRAGGLGAAMALGGLGVAVMAGGANRPLALLVLSLALAAGAFRASMTLGRGPATGASGPRTATGRPVLIGVALLAAGLPYAIWWGSHYRPEAFGIAALWLLLAALLFVLPGRRLDAAAVVGLEQSVLAGAGIAAAALCGGTDRPLEVGGFLAAMALLAVFVRRRWPYAEVVGILATALSVAPWMANYFDAGRARDACLVALPAMVVLTAALLARVLLARQSLGRPEIVGHLLLAGFTWAFAYTVLDAARPALKGPAAAAMAAAYLVLGMIALRRSERDPRLVRMALGLATAFLTLAIPIQLGLHGITLAWAAEGVLLLAMGTRFASAEARAGAYAVLSFAVLRLVAVHLPLHHGAFRPILNPAFGTWLAVVIALGAALWVSRAPRRGREPLDAAVGPVLGGLAILLLFGLLTAETQATFAQRRFEADRLADAAASQAARRVSALAVSVLWTIFATGLLAAGLAARNRPLFYAAYGLFAVTAGKVVLWDLDDFSVPYRMLAYLVLGLLLMAGAYLNLRFRQRLSPAPER